MSSAEEATSLLPYAKTDRQREYLEAIAKYKGQRAAAKALGVAKASLESSLALVRRRAASMG